MKRKSHPPRYVQQPIVFSHEQRDDLVLFNELVVKLGFSPLVFVDTCPSYKSVRKQETQTKFGNYVCFARDTQSIWLLVGYDALQTQTVQRAVTVRYTGTSQKRTRVLKNSGFGVTKIAFATQLEFEDILYLALHLQQKNAEVLLDGDMTTNTPCCWRQELVDQISHSCWWFTNCEGFETFSCFFAKRNDEDLSQSGESLLRICLENRSHTILVMRGIPNGCSVWDLLTRILQRLREQLFARSECNRVAQEQVEAMLHGRMRFFGCEQQFGLVSDFIMINDPIQAWHEFDKNYLSKYVPSPEIRVVIWQFLVTNDDERDCFNFQPELAENDAEAQKLSRFRTSWRDPNSYLQQLLPPTDICSLVWQYLYDYEDHVRQLKTTQVFGDIALCLRPYITVHDYDERFITTATADWSKDVLVTEFDPCLELMQPRRRKLQQLETYCENSLRAMQTLPNEIKFSHPLAQLVQVDMHHGDLTVWEIMLLYAITSAIQRHKHIACEEQLRHLGIFWTTPSPRTIIAIFEILFDSMRGPVEQRKLLLVAKACSVFVAKHPHLACITAAKFGKDTTKPPECGMLLECPFVRLIQSVRFGMISNQIFFFQNLAARF